MTVNTQRKINILQEVAEDDASLNLVLDKLLNVMRTQYASRLARYEADLRNFEARHGMASAAFYQQFEAGQLGDTMDFFEWSGLFELWQDLQRKVHRLEAF